MNRKAKSVKGCNDRGSGGAQCSTSSTGYQCPVAPWGMPCPVQMVTYVTSWSVPCAVQMPPHQQQLALPTADANYDKVEELSSMKEKLYHARANAVDLKERLTLALRSNDDLDDQLECFKLGYDDARMREERTVRELVALQKDASCKRTGQVRELFAKANMGAKIEKLSRDKTASIIVLADAIVAQHRKMNRLLGSLKSRNDEQATKHAKELEEVKTVLASVEAELSQSREETSVFRQHAQKLEEHISVHQKSRADHMESLERRCAEADEKMAVYEKKIATLAKKQLRSKDVAAKLYHEKKKLEENRSSGECCVCFEEGPLMIFTPCGHAACCLPCGAACELCPMCKGQVESRSPLYVCV